MPARRPALVASCLVVAVAWPLSAARTASAQAATSENRDRDAQVVVTTGEGIVKASPDRAFVTISAESRARTPREAQQRNAEAMSSVQQRLRAAGVPEDAIRTLSVDLQPEFDHHEGRQTLRGYVARNSIEVRTDDLSRLGEIVDASVASGATSVGDVRFDVKDRPALEREALGRAVADARARADAMAAGAGRAVGRVVRLEESGAGVPPPRPMYAMRAEAAMSAPTPVAPGRIEIVARVTLTSELK